MDCSSRGSPFAAVPARSSVPPRILQGLQLSSGYNHLFQHGVLHGMRCGYLFYYGPLWTVQGITCFAMVCPMGCRRSLFPLLLTWPWGPQLFLRAAVQHFLPFLKLVITETPLVSLTSSALSSGASLLEPSVTGSVQCGGSSWSLLWEDNPAAFCCQNLAM